MADPEYSGCRKAFFYSKLYFYVMKSVGNSNELPYYFYKCKYNNNFYRKIKDKKINIEKMIK